MESTRRICSNASDEQVSEVLISQEELKVQIQPPLSIKAEEDPYHTGAEAHEVQKFTPFPQTDESIKTELMLDEEFLDNMNESEGNYKQHVLALAGVPLIRAGISDSESETGQLSSHSRSPERLRKGCKDLSHRERIFECEFCPCAFRQKEILKRHLRIHTKDRQRDFACDLCGKMFFSNSNLERHKMVHTTIYKMVHPKTGHTNQLVGAGISDKTTVTSDSNSAEGLGKGRKALAHGERLLKCKFCPSVFKRKNVFEKHLRTHAKDRKQKFACELCEKTFCSKDSLETHKKAHAKKEFSVFCEVCGLSFSRRGNLKIHMLRKHIEIVQSIIPGARTQNENYVNTKTEEFLDKDVASCEQASQDGALKSEVSTSNQENNACEICHSIFPTEYMIIHRRMAHVIRAPRKAGVFECELCSRCFKTSYNLKMHRRTHSKDGKKQFACDLCERTFCSKSNLTRHKNIHTNPIFACDWCGSSFTQKANLKLHVLDKHLQKGLSIPPGLQTTNNDDINTKPEKLLDEVTEMKSKACQVCNHIYPTEYIKIHMSLAHSKPKYNCEVCLRAFKNKFKLDRHLRTHAKVRPLEINCDFCEKTFRHNSEFERHRNIHTNESRFVCDVCGSSFTQKGSLKTHMLRRHLKKREFACEICERTFGAKSSLNRHRKTHTKESSFICEECGTSFTQKGSLKTHMRRKHLDTAQSTTPGPQTADDDSMNKTQEEASFETVSFKVCGAGFTGEKSLRNHMRRKHPTNTPLPQKANEFPLQTKEELISDEELLEEEFLKI